MMGDMSGGTDLLSTRSSATPTIIAAIAIAVPGIPGRRRGPRASELLVRMGAITTDIGVAVGTGVDVLRHYPMGVEAGMCPV